MALVWDDDAGRYIDRDVGAPAEEEPQGPSMVWDQDAGLYIQRGVGAVSTPKTAEEMWQEARVDDGDGGTARWDFQKFANDVGVPGAVTTLKNFQDSYAQVNKDNWDGPAAHGYTPEKFLQTMYLNPRVVDTPYGQVIASDGPNPNFSGNWGDLGIGQKEHDAFVKKGLVSAAAMFAGGALGAALGGAGVAAGEGVSAGINALNSFDTGAMASILGTNVAPAAAASSAGLAGLLESVPAATGLANPMTGTIAELAGGVSTAVPAVSGITQGGLASLLGTGADAAALAAGGAGASFNLGNLGTYTINPAGGIVPSGVNLGASMGPLEAGLGSVISPAPPIDLSDITKIPTPTQSPAPAQLPPIDPNTAPYNIPPGGTAPPPPGTIPPLINPVPGQLPPIDPNTGPYNIPPGGTAPPPAGTIPPLEGVNVGTASNAAGLAKWLKDTLGFDIDPSTLGLLGTGLSTALGAYGANQQAKSLTDIANQARGDRQPALNAFNSALSDPNGWYNSAPAMGATEAVLRKLSVGAGNPATNPTALSQAAAYNLGGYNDYLRTMSGPAFGGQASTIAAQTNAAQGNTNVYNALGSGLASLTSNQPDTNGLLAQLLKSQYGLA